MERSGADSLVRHGKGREPPLGSGDGARARVIKSLILRGREVSPRKEDGRLKAASASLTKLSLENYVIRHARVSHGQEEAGEKEGIWLGKALVFQETISSLRHLKVIQLKGCTLDALPSLAPNLISLSFLKCKAGEVKGAGPSKSADEPWTLQELRKLRVIKIKNCIFPLKFTPKDSNKSILHTLVIDHHKLGAKEKPRQLDDSDFGQLPKSLRQVSLKYSSVTNRTLSKLTTDLNELDLTGCQHVPSEEDLNNRFPACVIEGAGGSIAAHTPEESRTPPRKGKEKHGVERSSEGGPPSTSKSAGSGKGEREQKTIIGATLTGKLLSELGPAVCDDQKLLSFAPEIKQLELTNYVIGTLNPSTLRFQSLIAQRDWLTGTAIAKFEKLTFLVLNNCLLERFPPIGATLEHLRLENCERDPTWKLPGLNVQDHKGSWKLSELKNLQTITIKNCTFGFKFCPTDVEKAKLKSLRVDDHNAGTRRQPIGLTDTDFSGFPPSLRHLSLKGSNVTQVTLGKVTTSLQRLELGQCPFIPTYEALSENRKSCSIEGVQDVELRRALLRTRLVRRVSGQSSAIESVLDTLKWGPGTIPKFREQREKPHFLCFVGPSTTPIATLAEAMADATSRPFAWYRTSELNERDIAKQLQGLQGEGKLFDVGCAYKNAVILFDRIEQGPAQIWNFLDWKIRDPSVSKGGVFGSLKDTIIILTFNVDEGELTRLSENAQELLRKKIRRVVKGVDEVKLSNVLRFVEKFIPFQSSKRHKFPGYRREIGRYIKALESNKQLGISVDDSAWVPDLGDLDDLSIKGRPIVRRAVVEIVRAVNKRRCQPGSRIHVSASEKGKALIIREEQQRTEEALQTNPTASAEKRPPSTGEEPSGELAGSVEKKTPSSAE